MRTSRIAFVLAVVSVLAACQVVIDQKDNIIRSAAAILMNPVVQAQSEDAFAQIAEPPSPCRQAKMGSGLPFDTPGYRL